jgi:subtilisin-like proprotein convertase family protein
MDGPAGLVFDVQANLYVSSRVTDEVLRYGPNSQAVFTVSLSSPVGMQVTVDFTTADGTATAGSDYVTTAGTLTFDPDVTERTMILPTIDDAFDESDETFVVDLTNASPSPGAALADNQGLGTILDNDTVGITVEPTSGLVTTEDGGTDTFTVVLDSQPTAKVTIAVSSSDTSEGAVGPASLSFDSTNWSTPQMVTVTGVDDAEQDGNVAYTIVLDPASSADPAYNGLDPTDVSVTNQDNDGQAYFFESTDVPKNIVDPHPKKGTPRPVTSVLTPTDSAIVDLVTVDATVIDAQWGDLTVTLAHPDGGSVELDYLGGNQWQVVDSTAFQGQALDRTWTLTIADMDSNGITGTLTAWSITVTPLTESAAASSQSTAATDMALLAWADPDSSEDEDIDPLATQAADEFALMLVE